MKVYCVLVSGSGKFSKIDGVSTAHASQLSNCPLKTPIVGFIFWNNQDSPG